MKYTIQELNELMHKNGVNLYITDSPITELPAGLVVGGNLYLNGTQITSLPDGLCVGGNLDLSGTQITSLPDGLCVGGYLDLSDTQITSLPDGLCVGGNLYLSGTQITSLPDELRVGGAVWIGGTWVRNKEAALKKVNQLKDGDYAEGRYIYCDGILTHVSRKKQIGEYTYFVGKIKEKNVIYDGEYYAHCRNFREGVADISFKRAADRGADQYKGYTLDTVITADEAKTMYRVITGACRAGTENFVNGLQNVKGQYTVREIIEITSGAYRGEVFRKFFDR